MLLENRKQFEELLGEKIETLQSITGGDISDAFLITTADQNYFLKINNNTFATSLFEAEVKGLQLLSQYCHTPLVLHQGVLNKGNNAFLILTYITSRKKETDFWVSLGQDLASLHSATAAQFGLDHSNFIGRLPQINNWCDSWADFYASQRLIPQVQLAYNNNLIPKTLLPSLDQLYKNISAICPNEKPSLIHGDLWSGNFMVGKRQEAVFIDPSVSYAHREMDLAMTHLFGGFDALFYESYEQKNKLEPGFHSRIPIYQLYYLLAHLNMFGESYFRSVERIVRLFS